VNISQLKLRSEQFDNDNDDDDDNNNNKVVKKVDSFICVTLLALHGWRHQPANTLLHNETTATQTQLIFLYIILMVSSFLGGF